MKLTAHLGLASGFFRDLVWSGRPIGLPSSLALPTPAGEAPCPTDAGTRQFRRLSGTRPTRGPSTGGFLAALFVAVLVSVAALAAPSPQIYSMAWRPDGAMIALGGYREARLVDAASRKPIATLAGHAE